MIKTVFLDLDDTILDFQKGEGMALRKAFGIMGIPCDDAIIQRYLQINFDCWRALERGELTREEVLVGIFERLFAELGFDNSPSDAQELYQGLLAGEHDFLPGGKEMLDSLYSSGKYKLYLATNGIPEVQYPRIAGSGIGEYFEKIFISYEIGYPKPRREFFEGCFKQIEDFKYEEAIIVGDSLTSDIKGGINAGIKTCHYNPLDKTYGEIIPDYKINNLCELLPLLESIE